MNLTVLVDSNPDLSHPQAPQERRLTASWAVLTGVQPIGEGCDYSLTLGTHYTTSSLLASSLGPSKTSQRWKYMYCSSALLIFLYTSRIISLETFLQFLMLLYLNAYLILIFVTILGDEDGFVVTFCSLQTALQNI